jgi:hypothetical protein
MAPQSQSTDWRDIAERASTETDPGNLMILVSRLYEALDQSPSNEMAAHYPSAHRRLTQSMCQPCLSGKHTDCPSLHCPCLCNDEDLRLPPKTAFGGGPSLRFEENEMELTLLAWLEPRNSSLRTMGSTRTMESISTLSRLLA